MIWSGRVTGMVIGESDVDFDMIALMEYPSRLVTALSCDPGQLTVEMPLCLDGPMGRVQAPGSVETG